jgi:hypothetical protein
MSTSRPHDDHNRDIYALVSSCDSGTEGVRDHIRLEEDMVPQIHVGLCRMGRLDTCDAEGGIRRQGAHGYEEESDTYRGSRSSHGGESAHDIRGDGEEVCNL